MAKPDYFVDIGPLLDDATDTLNNASTTLNMLGGCNNSETTLTVLNNASSFAPQSVDHEVFATLDDGTNFEIVRVLSVSSNDLLVVRGVEDTTPYAYVNGVVVERRLTQGMLQGLNPLHPVTGDVEIGRSSSAGADGIAIGTYSSAAADAVHIGSAGSGEGYASGLESIGIGHQARVNSGSDSAIVIGPYAHINTTSADRSIAIGDQIVVTGTSTDGVFIGASQIVQGSIQSAVIGARTETIGGYICTLGDDITQLGVAGVTLGQGFTGYHLGGMVAPPRIIGRTDLNYAATAPYTDYAPIGGTVALSSPPMDIGVTPAWATATTYTDQDVVVGAAHTGTKQAFFVYGANASDITVDTFYYGGTAAGSNEITSTTTPTFSDVVGGTANDPVDADHAWMTIDPISGVDIDPSKLGGASSGVRYKFVPTRIGFYAFNISATISADPTFSFGNEGGATEYFNAQAIDGLTDSGAHELQWFPIGEGAGAGNAVAAADTLVITLAAAATGASIHGRFIVEGYYIPLE